MTEQPQTATATTDTENDKLSICKKRLKSWSSCTDGYRWFLENFPQGGSFAAVRKALQADGLYSDATWLLDRLFAELDAGEIVRQTVLVSGADREAIEKMARSGGPDEAATTGYRANAATTGEGANAATTGEGANAATTGEGAIAAALGISARAKAGAGGAIVLAHRDQGTGDLIGVFSAMVGQHGIEPDTWYELSEDGTPVVVAE